MEGWFLQNDIKLEFSPYGLCSLEESVLLIGDVNNKVYKVHLDKDYKHVMLWQVFVDQIEDPHYIASNSNMVAISSGLGCSVHLFNSNGTRLVSAGTPLILTATPAGVHIDQSGRVYVVDIQNTVVIFNNTGSVVTRIKASTNTDTDMWNKAFSLAVSEDKLFVGAHQFIFIHNINW